ncbi:hypothetical protein V6N13_041435 [Hibiscus sabdariffa]|uniref:Uncharacterized protein n=1 Tax=Hibiscus sabdariffa TaxID=183260 RepID=A0ABR2RB93_9ROSI
MRQLEGKGMSPSMKSLLVPLSSALPFHPLASETPHLKPKGNESEAIYWFCSRCSNTPHGETVFIRMLSFAHSHAEKLPQAWKFNNVT